MVPKEQHRQEMHSPTLYTLYPQSKPRLPWDRINLFYLTVIGFFFTSYLYYSHLDLIKCGLPHHSCVRYPPHIFQLLQLFNLLICRKVVFQVSFIHSMSVKMPAEVLQMETCCCANLHIVCVRILEQTLYSFFQTS